jgi:hypothetical protein
MAMMPRRPLLLLTAGVLALHWLALAKMPLQSHAPLSTPGPVFSTRTLAAPAPQPPPPTPPARVTPVTAPTAPVRRAPARKKPATPAPAAAQAPATVASLETTEAIEAIEATDAIAASKTAEVTEVTSAAHTAPEEPAKPAEPTSTPAAAPASAIDIEPPGATAHSGPSATPAVQIPPSQRLLFDVSGEVKKLHYSARAELLWQHDGQQYQAQQEISILFLGSRTQTSAGALSDGGLRPQRFADRSRSEQAAHFNYAQGQVTFSANTPPATMVAGTQDRLSVFIQLGALLAAAPDRYPPGTRISLATVSARAADVWAFTVEDEETLDLPAGAITARKLQRLPRRDHDHDQKAELWLAPSLGYLPVRIRLTQANGDFADLRLRSHAPP